MSALALLVRTVAAVGAVEQAVGAITNTMTMTKMVQKAKKRFRRHTEQTTIYSVPYLRMSGRAI